MRTARISSSGCRVESTRRSVQESGLPAGQAAKKPVDYHQNRNPTVETLRILRMIRTSPITSDAPTGIFGRITPRERVRDAERPGLALFQTSDRCRSNGNPQRPQGQRDARFHQACSSRCDLAERLQRLKARFTRSNEPSAAHKKTSYPMNRYEAEDNTRLRNNGPQIIPPAIIRTGTDRVVILSSLLSQRLS